MRFIDSYPMLDHMVVMDAANSEAPIKNWKACRKDTARRVFNGVVPDRQEPHLR
jgi:hypothetical protein